MQSECVVTSLDQLGEFILDFGDVARRVAEVGDVLLGQRTIDRLRVHCKCQESQSTRMSTMIDD